MLSAQSLLVKLLRYLFRQASLVSLLALMAVLAPGHGMARQGGALSEIAESGVIHAGTRASAAPFAQKTDAGGFEGFSVDLLEEIRAAAEQQIGRAVRLELSEVTPADRLQRVSSGELHIVCGITTPTWDREAHVDFSLPFFRDGTRVMVYRGNSSGSDIGQLTIAVVKGTTTEAVLRDRLPLATLRIYDNLGAAMGGLRQNEVHGIANVGVVLLGLAQRDVPRRSVVLLPRTRALATETLACVLPQNDSPWRDLVNRTLITIFEGLANHTGRYEALYDRWFGRSGKLFYPLDRDTRKYLSDVSIWAR